MWRNASASIRAPYVEEEERERAVYKEKIREFNESQAKADAASRMNHTAVTRPYEEPPFMAVRVKSIEEAVQEADHRMLRAAGHGGQSFDSTEDRSASEIYPLHAADEVAWRPLDNRFLRPYGGSYASAVRLPYPGRYQYSLLVEPCQHSQALSVAIPMDIHGRPPREAFLDQGPARSEPLPPQPDHEAHRYGARSRYFPEHGSHPFPYYSYR